MAKDPFGPQLMTDHWREVHHEQVDRTVLPIRRPPFRGVTNKTLGGSQPDWD